MKTNSYVKNAASGRGYPGAGTNLESPEPLSLLCELAMHRTLPSSLLAKRMGTHPAWRMDWSRLALPSWVRAALGRQVNPLAPWINRVFLGDCLHLLRQVPAGSVDMVLTDPPYAVRYTDRSGRTLANDDNTRWVFPAFSELYRVLKPDSYCVCFYGWSKVDRFFAAWREIGFYPVGHFVWVKGYASGTRHTCMRHEQAYLLAKGNPQCPASPPSDVLDWSYTGNRLHPTQKPVAGLVPLIRAFTKPGAVVLDPFAGSGSTGVAAQKCGRRFILMEKDAEFHRAAYRRLTAAPLAGAAPARI